MEKKRKNRQMDIMIKNDSVVIWGRESKDEDFNIIACFDIMKDNIGKDTIGIDFVHKLNELVHKGYKLVL